MSWLHDLNFHVRFLFAAALMAACATLGAVISFFLTLLGRNQISVWATSPFVYTSYRYLSGIRFRIVSGSEYLNNVRPAILVGNHQSDLDIVMLATIWPKYCSVVAKKQMLHRPFLGWFTRWNGAIFVARDNTNADIKTLDEAARVIRTQRQSAFLFAEGTRSHATSPMLLPFKKGAFHLAIKAGAPILPIVTANYSHIYSRPLKRFRSGQIPVMVLPLVSTTEYSESQVDDLIHNVREMMLEALLMLDHKL